MAARVRNFNCLIGRTGDRRTGEWPFFYFLFFGPLEVFHTKKAFLFGMYVVVDHWNKSKNYYKDLVQVFDYIKYISNSLIIDIFEVELTDWYLKEKDKYLFSISNGTIYEKDLWLYPQPYYHYNLFRNNKDL